MFLIENMIQNYINLTKQKDFIIVDRFRYYNLLKFQNFLQTKINKISPKFYSLKKTNDKSLCLISYQLVLLQSKHEWFLNKNKEIIKSMKSTFNTIIIGLKSNTKGHLIMVIQDDNEFIVVDSSGASTLYDEVDIELNRLFGKYKYCNNSYQLQYLESKIINIEDEPDGYCMAWIYLLALFSNLTNKDINLIVDIILHYTNFEPEILRSLIRGFVYDVFSLS
jgi:hypothetical protein